MTMILKTYSVKVRGFPYYLEFAASAGKARAAAWRKYTGYDDSCTFKEFLRLSTLRRAAAPDGLGRKITVSGERAYFVPMERGLHFVRPDSDRIMLTHELDLEEGWTASSGVER